MIVLLSQRHSNDQQLSRKQAACLFVFFGLLLCALALCLGSLSFANLLGRGLSDGRSGSGRGGSGSTAAIEIDCHLRGSTDRDLRDGIERAVHPLMPFAAGAGRVTRARARIGRQQPR